MSRISEVIKNKNKVEKARKARRKNELSSLRNMSAFKAKLYDELQHIEVILGDDNVESVCIAVPDKYMNLFSSAIYSEDLSGYDVTQSDRGPNLFVIRRKFITF